MKQTSLSHGADCDLVNLHLSNVKKPRSLEHAWRLHRHGATIFAETRLGTLRCENGTIRILSPNAACVVCFGSTFSDHYKDHFFYRLREARNLLAIS